MEQLTDLFDQLRLDPTSELTIVGQVRAHLTLLIADGQVEPGSRLPSVRSLAGHLGINVNTVRSAYAKLEADGVVTTRHGVGTIVLAADAGNVAPSLPRHISNTVGVLIAGLDPFYLDLIRGIEAKADEQGTLLFIVDTSDSEVRARAAIRQLSARGVEGIIAVSVGGPGANANHGFVPPVVYVDQPDRAGNVILFNADKAGWQVTQHLIEHGHRRIGLLICGLDAPNQGQLLAGHRRALDDRGGAAESSLVVTVGGFDLASGRRGLRSLMEHANCPSAVIAGGGMLALGVLREAREQGLIVPDDLAIVGYGDVEATQFTSPAISMVALPAYEVGVAAMSALRRVMADPTTSPQRVAFDGALVVRESCGRHI